MHFVSSCVSTNRGGVITLFDNSYECLESHSDPESRLSALVIENDKLKVNVANVFCPNDYNSSLEFMGGVCDHILECIDRYLDAFVIMGGVTLMLVCQRIIRLNGCRAFFATTREISIF